MFGFKKKVTEAPTEINFNCTTPKECEHDFTDWKLDSFECRQVESTGQEERYQRMCEKCGVMQFSGAPSHKWGNWTQVKTDNPALLIQTRSCERCGFIQIDNNNFTEDRD